MRHTSSVSLIVLDLVGNGARALAALSALVMTSLASGACSVDPLAPIEQLNVSGPEDAGEGEGEGGGEGEGEGEFWEEGEGGEVPTTCGGDRAFSEPLNLGSEINEGARFIAQTFTPRAGGTLRGVRIHVHDDRGLPLTVAIRSTDATGTPLRNVLSAARVSITSPSDSNGEPTTVALPPIAVNAETTYAIVVSYDTAGPPGGGQSAGRWYGSSENPYVGGSMFASAIDGVTWEGSVEFDLFFDTFICE